MQTKLGNVFATVHSEGGILPADLLYKIALLSSEIPGVSNESYHAHSTTRLNEKINISWNEVLGAWHRFHKILESLESDSTKETATKEQWLKPLFATLGYGRLVKTKAPEIDGKPYAISHLYHGTPIHFVGIDYEIGKSYKGIKGAARSSPHSLLQEYLNRSGKPLWGFLSNGRCLRILRNNTSLTRQAYVEFDLEMIMQEQRYSDFSLLWLLCHESRVFVEEDSSDECWLEKWYQLAQIQGVRALDQLREGVTQAIEELGRGFLGHPANKNLRERLKSQAITTQDYYRQLLRLVYRLIFLFVAEDRNLLLLPQGEESAKKLYQNYYSTARLRKLAGKRGGTKHHDLWCGLQVVMQKLAKEGCPQLALPALGSFLWSPQAIADLSSSLIDNRHLLQAIRCLTYTTENHIRRPVDYKNLGAEELGSIYESLLECHPQIHIAAASFQLTTSSGNERKTSGSYYTPSSLIQCLLDSALDPVLESKKNPTEVLQMKICDPACGSGHFLIAAAHRIAKRLAFLRTADPEPAPQEIATALRQVISHCIYGVDLNAMAVELCKVSLWMESMEPGKPLGFLDHRIICGNSLLGTTPVLLEKGIPQDAFKPIVGDEKSIVATLKKRNKEEHKGQMTMFPEFVEEAIPQYNPIADSFAKLNSIEEDSLAAVEQKSQLYHSVISSQSYQRQKRLADAWCAAFVWPKNNSIEGFTQGTWTALRDTGQLATVFQKTIEDLQRQYQFFHWHLAFPEVFRLPPSDLPYNPDMGWAGGFDVVLGNPPWERIKLQEKEWFATRCPEIAQAANAAQRRKKISDLATQDPSLHQQFLDAKRLAEGESHFLRNSVKYPLCGRGDVNTYTVFAELNRQILNATGRSGCIVPSGIATDDTTKVFFQDLMESKSLLSLFDFENREAIFPGVHRSYKFCLLTTTGREKPATSAEFVFFALKVTDLQQSHRRFTLSAEDIALINPNTRTCPIFRSQRDAEITKSIYRRVPVLIDENRPDGNPWGISFMRMFDMTNDSHLFYSQQQLQEQGFTLQGNIFIKAQEKYLPLYEAKMIHHFNHRFGDYNDLPADSKSTQLPQVSPENIQNPYYAPMPRYWVNEMEVRKKVQDKWQHKWLMGWRDICRSTDERTVISGILPLYGVGHTYAILIFKNFHVNIAGLFANFATFIFDFIARQKIGGTHLTHGYIKQLPCMPPMFYEDSTIANNRLLHWLLPRVLELTYTSWDLQDFAQDCGYDGPPFRWDEERRFLLRCELDAAYFHLYKIVREDVDYIMETFPIVKRKDQKEYNTYRTKDTILQIYDAMQQAIDNSSEYQTILNPPPADPSVRQFYSNN